MIVFLFKTPPIRCFHAHRFARHFRIDPEIALRGASSRFERRFEYIGEAFENEQTRMSAATLAEPDALWDEARAIEKSGSEQQVDPIRK